MKRVHLPRWFKVGATALILFETLILLPTAAAAPSKDLSEEEKTFLNLLQAKRKELGKTPLVENAKLTAAARVLSDLMIKTGQFDHAIDGSTLTGRVNAQKYEWKGLVENISGKVTAQECFDGWMKSKFHHDNMLGDYSEVGIGRVQDGKTIRWTLVLANPANEKAPDDKPEPPRLIKLSGGVSEWTGAITEKSDRLNSGMYYAKIVTRMEAGRTYKLKGTGNTPLMVLVYDNAGKFLGPKERSDSATLKPTTTGDYQIFVTPQKTGATGTFRLTME